MKSGKLFIVISCAAVLFMVSTEANAVPVLDLWITGELVGIELTVEIHRTNTDFGLGGLSYELQFSEFLELSREYSDSGWVADDDTYDISNPIDIGVDGSALGSFTSIQFDTVRNSAGSEFADGTTGTVEVLTCILRDVVFPNRWIYFDLVGPSASNGAGDNLETTLGGSINIIPTIYPDPLPPLPGPPESGHSMAYGVPEPTTLMLFGLGGLALRRRSRQALRRKNRV